MRFSFYFWSFAEIADIYFLWFIKFFSLGRKRGTLVYKLTGYLNYDGLHATPIKKRIDAPGALHHIVARGIERKRIFTNGVDRDNFLNRPGKL
ncbi:MAG: hypothetical protein Q7J15_06890 [Candidatus Desulfaltia sp.]|nr:hypothetical protein [Candidatus Desulfaltia sp.]